MGTEIPVMIVSAVRLPVYIVVAPPYRNASGLQPRRGLCRHETDARTFGVSSSEPKRYPSWHSRRAIRHDILEFCARVLAT